MATRTGIVNEGKERHPAMGGRKVLITGAAGGLGEALASAFAAAGCDLVLADRDGEGLRRVAARLPCLAWHHTYDQSDRRSAQRLAVDAGTVDILVNNAGVLAVGPFLEMNEDDIEQVIRVDLLGLICLSQSVAREMSGRGGGVIVNVASQLAFCGGEGRAAYAAAKAGVVQFTRTAAVELAPFGIRVCGIAPGRVATPMTAYTRDDPAAYAESLKKIPVRRFAEPAEIAEMVVFLASDKAAYVVGETLLADGGYVLS